MGLKLRRVRRGANIQTVAVAGPPIQLSESDFNFGYESKSAISADSPSTNDDDEEDEEGQPLRGGAMWSLARLLLWGYLLLLAGGLAVCFASQLGSLCRACKQLCCLCVRSREGDPDPGPAEAPQRRGSGRPQRESSPGPGPGSNKPKGLELRELYTTGRRAPGSKKHAREKAHRFPDTALCISGSSSDEDVLYDARKWP